MLGNSEKDLVKTSKLKFKRKKVNTNSEELVYKFNSFDDFCNFTNLLQNASIKSINLAAKSTILYKYADSYYLAFLHINPDYKYNKKLFSLLTEFSTYKNNPALFSRKLCECGEVVIKNNAIKICQKYFI